MINHLKQLPELPIKCMSRYNVKKLEEALEQVRAAKAKGGDTSLLVRRINEIIQNKQIK